SDRTLRLNDALIFNVPQATAVRVARSAAGGSAAVEIGPAGPVEASLRLYATCPDLFRRLEATRGTITFTRFPPPPAAPAQPFQVHHGDELEATFELDEISDLETGEAVGAMSGRFAFTIRRGPGSSPFP